MKDWIKRNLHRRTYGAICLLAGMGLPGSAAPADPPGGNPFGSSNPFASRPANPATIGAPNVRPGLPTNLPGACPDTLANLVSTWPRYRDPMLAQLLDNMKSAAPDLGETEVRKVLGSFLFSGDAVDKPAGVLSGGE